MGQVPLTPISGSFTDLLCGLRPHFSGPHFPQEEIFPLAVRGGGGGGGGNAKRSKKRCLLFKDAPMKCIRPFS